jgi:class 3 adenylate cyclase
MSSEQERVERRLAAILAADVAGYSRLMGKDEEGTLAPLKEIRRELADPKIAEHRGTARNSSFAYKGQFARSSSSRPGIG